ncbi:MAG: hypothetical protein VKL98_10365 [Cyanobacteriota bacterium]|nr:hypothetical protein [Cyanobacteriota bacterium]
MPMMRQWIAAVIVPLGLLALAQPAMAEAPAIYYAWRSATVSQAQCLGQAEQALTSQQLATAQTDDTSVAGQGNDATAVFVCLKDGDATTVMIIVASSSEDRAMALREALKQAF